MKRRTGTLIALLLVVLAGLTAALGHFRLHEHATCELCFSMKREQQWWIGLEPLGYPIFGHDKTFADLALPLSAKQTTVTRSAADLRLFQSHPHRWQFRGAARYYWFGQRPGGILDGPPSRQSPFADAYLHNPDFPAFVDELLRSNRLSRERAMELFSFQPPYPRDSSDPRSLEALAIMREFHAGRGNKSEQRPYLSP